MIPGTDARDLITSFSPSKAGIFRTEAVGRRSSELRALRTMLSCSPETTVTSVSWATSLTRVK
ncbi:MAG: hypothetical protein R2751_14070 [Bacteroidales bacterium]